MGRFGARNVAAETRRRSILLAIAGLAALAPPAHAQYQAAEAQNFLAATGRAQAWALDPGFLAAPADVDPARDVSRWSPERGQALAVSWRNRYGARISGHLFRPKSGAGPFPAVVVVPGAGVAESGYWWVGEDLAEHGYVVLTFDPQGQGASDVAPAAEYCDPSGAWRQPQEMGIREQGDCAGQDPSDATGDAAVAQVLFLARARSGRIEPEDIGPTYRALAPRFVLGALDATAWLLSGANPWRAAVDASRLGVAGHSLGAYAANMAGNGDPKRRFRAAVAMDAFYANDLGVGPRVPTLVMQSEQETFLGPHPSAPADPRSPTTLHPTRATFEKFPGAGVDSAFLVPSASNHNDFTDALQPASFLGQRTAALALIAWMDDYVAGRGGIARMLASPAGDSADQSSIGTGRPLIAGRTHAELLSFNYPTDVELAGRSCKDLRVSPCLAPPRCTPQAAVKQRRDRTRVRLFVSWARACGRVHLVRAELRRRGRKRALSSGERLTAPVERAVMSLRIPARSRGRSLQVVVRIDGRRV